MKKIIAVVMIAVSLIMVIPSVSYAAFGNSLSLYAAGNSNSLIYIKRPESHSASTSDRTYTISAVGAQGTKVRIYESSTTGPLGKPGAYKLPSWHTWDPTDPTAKKYCDAKGCH